MNKFDLHLIFKSRSDYKIYTSQGTVLALSSPQAQACSCVSQKSSSSLFTISGISRAQAKPSNLNIKCPYTDNYLVFDFILSQDLFIV